MQKQQIGIGIIGCGGIAGLHLEAIRRTPSVRLAGCHDTNAETLARIADTAGCPAFPRIDDLLTSPGLDAVVVATPPAFHAEVALKAIEHGLHVLCEKPVAMDSAQAKQMVDTARGKGVRLLPAFCHRFTGAARLMQRMVDDGAIGDMVFFRNAFVGDSSGLIGRWFTNKALSGGGVVMDTLVHSIDLFHFFAGYSDSVASATAGKSLGLGIEDTAVLALRSDRGVAATLTGCWSVASGRADFEIFGTRGSLAFDYFEPDSVRWQKTDGVRESITVQGADERFANQMAHFAGVILGSVTEPLVDERAAVESMLVVDRIYGES